MNRAVCPVNGMSCCVAFYLQSRPFGSCNKEYTQSYAILTHTFIGKELTWRYAATPNRSINVVLEERPSSTRPL